MTSRRSLRLLVGLLLAAFFLWMVMRGIALREVWRAFEGARLPWIGCAVGAFAAGYSCRIQRWRLMLRHENPGLRWRDCAGPLLASVAANNVLPFRAGDVVRVFGFNARLGISAGIALATLLAERTLDLLVVLAILAASLAAFGVTAPELAGGTSAVLLVVCLSLLLLLAFPRRFEPLAHVFGGMIARVAPAFGARLAEEIGKGIETLVLIARSHTMPMLVWWSVLAWLAEGGVFWFTALALPSVTAPSAAWFALPVGTLSTLIPSTPGFVGTFDFFTARAMTALGNSPGGSVAFAFLLHAIVWLPPTLAGGLYLALRPTRPAGPRLEPPR